MHLVSKDGASSLIGMTYFLKFVTAPRQDWKQRAAHGGCLDVNVPHEPPFEPIARLGRGPALFMYRLERRLNTTPVTGVLGLGGNPFQGAQRTRNEQQHGGLLRNGWMVKKAPETPISETIVAEIRALAKSRSERKRFAHSRRLSREQSRTERRFAMHAQSPKSIVILTIIATCMASLWTTRSESQERVKQEAVNQLQGEWTLVAYVVDGRTLRGEDTSTVLVIEDNRWTIKWRKDHGDPQVEQGES
jgi:hypothetical protein